MERQEQLLRIVSHLSPNEDTALKYAVRLEELFDAVIGEKIGNHFCEAIRSNDYTAALHLLATYFRSKADFTVPGICTKGRFDVEIADNCTKGTVRSVNID